MRGIPKNRTLCSTCGIETRPRQFRCVGCGSLLQGVSVARWRRDRLTALLLCVFTGFLGGHRFYTGHIAVGAIQALTFGGFFCWWLYDLVQIVTEEFLDAEGRFLEKC
jgi:hypothetical protein